MKWVGLLSLMFSSYVLAQDIDVPQLCRDAGQYSAEASLDSDVSSLQGVDWESSPEELSRKYFSHFQDRGEVTLASWEFLFSPRLSHRIAGHLLQLTLANRYLRAHGHAEGIDEVLRSFASKAVPYSGEALQEHRDTMAYLKSRELKDMSVQAKQALPALCVLYPFFRCKQALTRVIDLMDAAQVPVVIPKSPDWGAVVSLPGAIDRLFSAPEYRRGTALLALRMLDKIRLAREGQLPVSDAGNLFDDSVSAFRDSGQSEEKAIEMTMVMLGFYATRGASLDLTNRLTNSESYPLYTALYVVSTGLGVLDAYLESSGNYYSLPSRYRGTCAFGRPYHFWMAAYLSWELRREGFPRVASFLAPHIAGMLYEVGFSFQGDNDPVYVWPFRNPALVNMQVNMTFDDAGADFGVKLADRESDTTVRPIPQALSIMLSRARPMPSLSKDQINEGLKDLKQRFFWFRRIVAPDAELRYWLP